MAPGWLPTLRLHDTGLLTSISERKVVVVRAVWTLERDSNIPLIRCDHIQGKSSSETGGRLLWTQPALACACLCVCDGKGGSGQWSLSQQE